MARRPDTGEDRRIQIIEAALSIFSQKGFTKATNKEIAEEAGVTAGLIYHHFDNKDALLKEVINTYSPLQWMEKLPEKVWNLPLDAFLRFILVRVFQTVEDKRYIQLIRVVFSESIYNPSVATAENSMFQNVTKLLAKYMEKQKNQEELHQELNTELIAQLIIGMVMGFVLRRHLFCDPTMGEYSQEEIVDTVVTTVLKGLQKE